EFREAVLDAVVKDATVEVPDTLVEARARELWERMLHSLGHQGITREAYLQIAGKTEEDIIDDARPEAEQVLRREAVIAAVIEAESIEPSDGDLLDALQEDLAQRQAIDFLAENARSITADQAKVREKLWTPDQEYPKGVEKPIW